MHGNIIRNGNRATKATPVVGSEVERATAPTPTSGNGQPFTPASGTDPDEWFYDAAQVLLGKDAGYALHLLTGYPLSSCYAYVAKDPDARRKVPENLIRKLIHREDGEPWHSAWMHGCTARWWDDWRDGMKMKRAIENR